MFYPIPRRLEGAMASETVTLALNGEIALDVFADEIRNWTALLSALAKELAPRANIEWFIEDLQPGSASTTARAESADANASALVIRAYADVGRALQRHQPPPYSPAVRQRASAIVKHIGKNITSIRFETPDEDITVVAHDRESQSPDLLRAYGTVAGRIQTLSSRKRLGFTLYDSLFDKAVNCYLRADQVDLIRDKWDRRAVVEGLISRDPETGRPVAIRAITDITVLPENVRGDYRDAEGMLANVPGEEPAEVIIGRLRDAW